MRLRTAQGFEDRQGGRYVAEPTSRHAHDQGGDRMPWDALQDLSGLLERQRRMLLKQVERVSECDVERSDRLRCATPPFM